ncbi:MAG: glycerophosphodiester phosphodiesterase [Pseudomonadota bacterium]
MHPYLAPAGFKAFAHRGDHDAAPENTFAAFSSAVAMGYRYLETDVHLSRDGVLFAFHDDALDRVTDSRGRLSDLDAAQIRRARVGNAERVPEMVELFEAFPEVHFNIEPKSDAAVAPLVELIRHTGSAHRVCVGSFSGHRIDRVRAALPEVCTSMGPLETTWARLQSLGMPTPGIAAHCAQVPCSQWGIRLVDAAFVDSQHRHGRETHVWTVNDKTEMQRLIDLGVDGIMTDHPALLKAVLEDCGLWR